VAFIDDVAIANMALSHVGASSDIESFTEKSTEAVQCNAWYDASRKQILAAHDWGFARRRRTLALHGDIISEASTDPLAGVWGFRYEYPGDCVKVRKIQNPNAPPDDLVPFNVETSLNGQEKTILTNMEDAVLVYTWDQEGTELFTPMFVQALSHLLASQIAFAVTNKRKIKLEQLRMYFAVLKSAAAEDINEGIEPPVRDVDWIRGR
jgi:hypothetical protein